MAGQKGSAGRKKKLSKSKLPIIKKLIIEKGHFNVSNLAKAMGVSWLTMKRFVNKHPEVEVWLNEANEELVDMAENTIHAAIKAGDFFTAKWLLSLRSKKYKESPIEVKHEGDINITIKRFKDEK